MAFQYDPNIVKNDQDEEENKEKSDSNLDAANNIEMDDFSKQV